MTVVGTDWASLLCFTVAVMIKGQLRENSFIGDKRFSPWTSGQVLSLILYPLDSSCFERCHPMWSIVLHLGQVPSTLLLQDLGWIWWHTTLRTPELYLTIFCESVVLMTRLQWYQANQSLKHRPLRCVQIGSCEIKLN